MASQSGEFNVQQFNDLGDPLIGGRLYTYAYGTTTQKTAFTDPAGAVPHTYTSDGLGGQYIALNARGELPAPLYLGNGPYDLTLKTAAGATIWTRRAQGTLIASNIIPVQLASAATVDIGGQGVTSIEITGNTNISSFGTNYAGPIFVRFLGSLTLVHNSVTLNLPGGTNSVVNPGDIVIASGNSNNNGWNVLVVSQNSFAKAGANTDITSWSGGPLAGLRNRVINGGFDVNQRVVSGTVTLSVGQYGHDRWKAGASGCTYTFATLNNVTTLTITAGSLQQVIEGLNLESGTYALSWSGTAQGKIGGGSFAASGVSGAVTGGVNTVIEFNTGTLSKVQLEFGGTATAFERRTFGVELALCQRYFCKTFLYSVAPANNTGSYGGVLASLVSSASFTGNCCVNWRFPQVMRAAPSVTPYNPGASGAGRFIDSLAVSIAASAINTGDSSTMLYCSGGSLTVNAFGYVHATAEAEL